MSGKNIAWYYYDTDKQKGFYANSWEMSVTDFAIRVSEKLGYGVKPEQISACDDKKKMEKYIKTDNLRKIKP